MKPQAIQPAVWIAKRLQDRSPAELFLAGSVAVRCEPGVNELTFCLCEKLGGIGVVLDEPVCCKGHDNSGNALLQ